MKLTSLAAQVAAFQLSQLAITVTAAEHKQVPFGPVDQSWTSDKKPNIVFILTDDQDLHMDSLDYLPFVQKHLISQGTLYKRHFCTTAVCCPSRVSLWTGRLAHNTNVTDVNPPYGGYPKFVKQGFNSAYLPIWLQEAGYDTYYTGKLFNSHSIYNYDDPYIAGWNTSDCLLDPFTYQYVNSTYQRNKEAPVNYAGQHTIDIITDKAYSLLDDAASGERPFFLGIAPVAPHSNVNITHSQTDIDGLVKAVFSAPVPAKRHEHLFQNVTVPRTKNFNPDKPSGVSWIKKLPQQTQENIDYNDDFYRNRLRALQGVDELVDGLVTRLENLGLLDNTYIFYTTDNGYHIGQHRLQPGKECGFEEDINIPLVVRGPNVPAGQIADFVTTHIDLAPTLLRIAGAPLRDDFDGDAIPLTSEEQLDAKIGKGRHEHVTVEYWGYSVAEGDYWSGDGKITLNNTYKALRIVGEGYNLYYSVWCSHEHQLYDLTTDPDQLINLLDTDSNPDPLTTSILDTPLDKILTRLDSLLLVLKSCQGKTCIRPWDALHPNGDVNGLMDALNPEFDAFYEEEQPRVRFDRCELGYILDAEGPQFEQGLMERMGARWDEWV